jgi:cation transport ATPase
MHDDFSKIPETIRLSKKVMEIVRENFVLWGILNVIGLTLVFKGILMPSSAAAYNFLTDFIPLFNAMRVLRF